MEDSRTASGHSYYTQSYTGAKSTMICSVCPAADRVHQQIRFQAACGTLSEALKNFFWQWTPGTALLKGLRLHLRDLVRADAGCNLLCLFRLPPALTVGSHTVNVICCMYFFVVKPPSREDAAETQRTAAQRCIYFCASTTSNLVKPPYRACCRNATQRNVWVTGEPPRL